LFVTAKGYFGIAKVAADVANVALVVPAAFLRSFNGSTTELLEQWIGSHSELRERFHHATRVAPVRATGPFASRARKAFAPGAVLVGDAADFFDPFTGEGIYAALKGGEIAAPFIRDAIQSIALRNNNRAIESLAAYDSVRRQTFGGKWRVEKTIGAAVAFPSLMNLGARILRRDSEYSDLLVGVTGDFVPASELIKPQRLMRLAAGPSVLRSPVRGVS
jgi:flavin-dependent dehydrogenase